MPTEIERKYLVKSGVWTPKGPGVHFQQGYLNTNKERVVRVRIESSVAKLTIKGVTRGVTRSEFEYGIPLEDAAIMLNELCERPLIDKHRHVEYHGHLAWEIDVFHGENEGLVIAEVELPSADTKIELPCWAGAEVSSDPRYFNSNLLQNPYSTWPKS
jgi:adenylate cyclase